MQLPDTAKVIPIFLPSHPLPESQLGRKMSNGSSVGDDPVSPMNLSVRRSSDPEHRSSHVTLHVNNDYDDHHRHTGNGNDDHHRHIENGSVSSLNNNNVVLPSYASRSAEDSEDFEESASNFSGEYPNAAAAAEAR